jgi:hypothetical protein
LSDHGWKSSRVLSIGIGGGIGWVMLLQRVGSHLAHPEAVIQWTRDNATNGTPMPDKTKAMARQAFWYHAPTRFCR